MTAPIRFSVPWIDPQQVLIAEELLANTEPGQLLMAEQHFFGGGSYPLLQLGGSERFGLPSALRTHSGASSLISGPDSVQGPIQGPVQDSEQILLEAIRSGTLELQAADPAQASHSQSTDERNALRVKIRLALADIVSQERAEAAGHAHSLANESHLMRGLIYTGAFFNGLWHAGTDFAQWLQEVNDVVNPTQRILRSLRSGMRARERASVSGESYLDAFVSEQLTAEKRQLVEAIGFDPSSITREQFDQALEIAELVWQDPALRADIRRFCVDYVNAQHAVELTAFSGTAAFEVLFTLVLAAVTAGAGVAVAGARQARHFARFRKVGDLLKRYADEAALAAKRKAKSAAGGNSQANDFGALPREEVLVKSTDTSASRPPKPKANSANENPAAQNRSAAAAPPVAKRARPEPDNWKTYKTHGVEQAPMASAVGREMVEVLEAQGLSRAEAVMKAQEFLASGSELPVKKTVKQGEKLYKLVPAGETPGKYSAYFAELSDIQGFEGVSYDELTDAIGIPLESQQIMKFDLMEVEALEDVTVYQSTIAPTSQNGYSQPGGGRQTLIINRSQFSDPKSTGRKFP
ncbi:hypothetical protein KUV95_08110 [Microbulbifer agarilyticus]|uniref:hypothetical protein n=1 Tax=Microbulbifer agarilyticus TaxID=260552 RepID=UPI001C9621BA|nr:hypothetical protein [Microbulbifer agarilyticus]MBY6211517.1 hypothetical protein [Microbulbifer agarilyticus]